MQRIVVAGAGMAGMHTVIALRRQGFDGEIVMVGAESHPPYDRPPLSKRMLLDPEPFDSTLPFDVEKHGVDLRTGVRAVALRPGVLDTTDGEIAYDGVVLATGSAPIRLPGPGGLYLRTRESALELRSRLRAGARVVIVGAGWIGAEVATAAARHGCSVTVVEQAAAPASHALPVDVGGLMTPWYVEAGIDLRLDTRVAEVHDSLVLLTDGSRLEADLVVVGVGVRPATDWLEGTAESAASVEVDRGVLVGPDLRVPGLPGAVAVGDVAARWSARYGVRVRGEHWDDALRMGPIAAANLLSSGESQAYDPVPYIWSEQFDRMVQFAGLPMGDRTLRRRDDVVLWLDDEDRILAVFAVDQPRDFTQARKLANQGVRVDPALLADPDTPVKSTAVS